MDDLTGQQLGGFRIEQPLGEGGMAIVYRAYQESMDRFVAVKVMHRFFARDPEFQARFAQEARLIAKLEHPNIIPIYDFGDSDGHTYIAMRFVEGGTLADLMTGTPMPLEQVKQIIGQIGSALNYAHSRGVIHRDIKPSNILVDTHGNSLLTDFGFAKMLEGQSNLSLSGAAIGTPAYMSPEQILGQALDGRSDMYSLGIVLYKMVTGRTPFKAETPTAVFVKHINDRLPPPSNYNPDLPEQVEQVIFKALAKDPDDRYATMSDFVKALDTAIMEGPRVVTVPSQHEDPSTPPFLLSPTGFPPVKLNGDYTANELSIEEEVVLPREVKTMPLILGISALTIIVLLLVVVGFGGMAFGQQLVGAGTPGTVDPLIIVVTGTPGPTAEVTPTAITSTRLPDPDMTEVVVPGEGGIKDIPSPTLEVTPTNTPPPFGTIIFRECRGQEGTLTFANFAPSSLHSNSSQQFTVRVGSYRLRIDWLNTPDLNVDTFVQVREGVRVLEFGDQCQR